MTHTIAAAVHAELIIRKSRFVGCVQPVADRVQAQQLVQALRSEHPKATHVCWALLAGGESAAVDDGEPAGTAGLPMLAVLRKQELDGVLATVVRYFGGVKLGAGGLVRAYTDAVAQALKDAEKVVRVPWIVLGCSLPYALEGVLRHALQQYPVRGLQVRHGQQVHMHFEVTQPEAAALRAQLDELAHGQLLWTNDEP